MEAQASHIRTNGHKPAKISRRSFLQLALFGSIAAFAGQTLAALFQFLKPPKVQGFGGMVYAGRVEDVPIDNVQRVMAGRFYLVHNQAGILAVYQKCTHLGCAVPYNEAEGQFHCPCHGSLFNIVGEVTGGPAPRPLDIFPVTIENGEIWVDTGSPIVRSSYEDTQVTKV